MNNKYFITLVSEHFMVIALMGLYSAREILLPTCEILHDYSYNKVAIIIITRKMFMLYTANNILLPTFTANLCLVALLKVCRMYN